MTVSAPAAPTAANATISPEQSGLHPAIIRSAFDLNYTAEDILRALATNTPQHVSLLVLNELFDAYGADVAASVARTANIAFSPPAPKTAQQPSQPKTAQPQPPAKTAQQPPQPKATYGQPPSGQSWAAPSGTARVAPTVQTFPWPEGMKRGIAADLTTLALTYTAWRVDAFFLLTTLNAIGMPITEPGDYALLNPLTFSLWLAIPVGVTVIQRAYWPKPKKLARPADARSELLLGTTHDEGTTTQDRVIWGATIGINALTTIIGMAVLLYGTTVGGVTIPAFGWNLALLLLIPLALVAFGLAVGPEWVGISVLRRLLRRIRLVWLWMRLRLESWQDDRSRQPRQKTKK